MWLSSQGSCILWYFCNYKCFYFALDIWTWPSFTKKRFTKWKLYLWYWYIITWRHELHISKPYKFFLYAFFFILQLYHLNLILFTFGFTFFLKLCNLLQINLWYLWLFSYESCILGDFFNYKYFIYALEILSWRPSSKVRFIKREAIPIILVYYCLETWGTHL